MKTTIKIYNPSFINPFLAYSLFWIISIVCYQFSPSTLNIPLDVRLIIFLILTIFISLVIAFFFNNKYKNKRYILSFNHKHFKIFRCLNILLIITILLEFIYSQQVPLFGYIFSSNANYKEFGIPTVHVILSTFLTFYAIYLNFMFFQFKYKSFLFYSLIPVLYYLLIFSRGILVFIFVASICLYLIDKKIKYKHFLVFIPLLIIFSILFGVLGNIRSGFKWNDSYSILNLASIDKNRYSITSALYWAFEYFECSLRNLNFNIKYFNPVMDSTGFLCYLPDFISKRFNDNLNIALLQHKAFTTGTMYVETYTYFGFLGMILIYFQLMIFAFMVSFTKFKNNSLQLIELAILFFITSMSIFDNSLNYSGYSFTLFYPVIFSLVCNKRG